MSNFTTLMKLQSAAEMQALWLGHPHQNLVLPSGLVITITLLCSDCTVLLLP